MTGGAELRLDFKCRWGDCYCQQCGAIFWRPEEMPPELPAQHCGACRAIKRVARLIDAGALIEGDKWSEDGKPSGRAEQLVISDLLT